MAFTDRDQCWSIRTADGALWSQQVMTETEAREMHTFITTLLPPDDPGRCEGATMVNLLDEVAERLPPGARVAHTDTGEVGRIADNPRYAIWSSGMAQVCVDFPDQWNTWDADCIRVLAPGETPARRLPSRLTRPDEKQAVAALAAASRPTDDGLSVVTSRGKGRPTAINLNDAIKAVRGAVDFAWARSVFGLELIVLTSDHKTLRFDLEQTS